MKIAGKIYGSFGWSALASVYLIAGATGSSWNPVNQMNSFIEHLKKQEKIANYKSSVIDYVDTNNNGLRKQEQSQIDTLMGIQDSSKTYVPSSEDWERAYFSSSK